MQDGVGKHRGHGAPFSNLGEEEEVCPDLPEIGIILVILNPGNAEIRLVKRVIYLMRMKLSYVIILEKQKKSSMIGIVILNVTLKM